MYSQQEVENFLKKEDELVLLENKIQDLNRKDFLNDAESDLLSELHLKANEIRRVLPNKPVTLQNSVTSSRRPGAFKNLGEQLIAVRKAGTPGQPIDSRLYNAATGLSEQVPSEGGFLLQQDFGKDIYQAAFSASVIPSLCRRVQISGNANSIKIPALDESSRADGSRNGGVLSYWKSEASELTGSKPKFRELELNLKKQVVLVYSTDELLQDAVALEGFIRKVAADELSFNLADAIINGTGAGQPLGILNSGSLVSVAKESGQKADTIVFENILKMWSRMIGPSRSNAVWLINQSAEQQLFSMSLSVGTGGAPVYLPGGGASDRPYASLFGRPVIPCEQCAALGDQGDIILADFSNGYILAEKGGIQADVSIHVSFLYDQSVFRFIMRVDGQPMLDKSVTPFKGSDALSHFVALAARA